MRHFHRTHIPAPDVVALADQFFPTIGLRCSLAQERSRTYTGALGTMTLRVRPEGGHYTLIEVATDQTGESRLDRNVKRFFVKVHRAADPSHTLTAAY
jgi:hypothetical protein